MAASQIVESTSENAIRRRTMVDCQIRTVDVTDHAVVARFLEVPRENFLPVELAPFAYSDMPLKLPSTGPDSPARQLMSPAILARLIQAAAVKPSDKVLDVASATGYSTAILAGLAKEVVAIEPDPERSASMKASLATVGLGSLVVATGPATAGLAASAPFDVIFVNGAVEAHLDILFSQLRSGGRLLAIVRRTEEPDRGACHAVRFERQSDRISSAFLFDADVPVLPEFRKELEFQF
jgi:protein-L-isoaspartate(D-aspartate) O-methyltransferase